MKLVRKFISYANRRQENDVVRMLVEAEGNLTVSVREYSYGRRKTEEES